MSQSINLIPQEEKQDQQRVQVVKFSTILTILLVIVVGSLSAFYFYKVIALKDRINDYDKNIERMRGEIQVLAPIEISARNLDTRYAALKNIYASRIYFSWMMEELEKKNPGSVTIQSLAITKDNTFTINAMAENYIAIADFVKEMTEDTEIFKEVTLNSVTLDTKTNLVNFFVIINYNPDSLKKSI